MKKVIHNSKLIDILNKLRQKHSITIWCNPRGVFLAVHLDDTNDGVADIDGKKFEHPNDLLDFLAELVNEADPDDPAQPPDAASVQARWS